MRNMRSLLLLPSVFLTILPASCSFAPDNHHEVDTTVQPGKGLTAEIRLGTGAYSIRGLYSVVIRFHNASPDVVSILKPLDGSSDCWHMPYYRFTVWDHDHKLLKPRSRDCGNSGLWADSQWPQNYLVEIKPGASFDIEQALPSEVEKDGLHTIAFEYVYQPTNERLAPPAGAWRGSVKAAAVVLNLKQE